ncbi:hypothetical protein AURDEDRAFT_154911 [Auricularia subglabra TFB-10046 SS5]|uniref:Uncharacterized protein n=1 Tax=Auricularia subglabra (strain TFB-10046 / SS5) TaxID=717982 RepID=J0WRE6_AURST|nr:hypothetical protein AURDEDRAFT_154911 [Auricularia subglabra TFB-10046 SS5]
MAEPVQLQEQFGVLPRHAPVATNAHPIQLVPPEILGVILEHSVDAYLPGRWSSALWAMVHYDSDDRKAWQALGRTPFTLAAVCKRWHSVAHGTPSLWRYIGAVLDDKMDGVAAERLTARIRLLMARAGSVPLYIVIYCARYASADARGLWPLVKELVPRTGTLYMSCMNEASFAQLAHCLRQPVPHLADFVLRTVQPGGDRQPALAPFGSAPRLRRLHWAWDNIAWETENEGLHVLPVEEAEISQWELSAPGLLKWLARLPAARTLEASAGTLALAHPAPAPVTLVHLHTLTLKLTGMDLATAQSLVFPHVRRATVICFLLNLSVAPPAAMNAFLSRALRAVEELTLVYPPSEVDTEVLTALHALRTLDIGNDMVNLPLSQSFYDAFLPQEDGTWPCPRLEALTVQHDGIEMEWLLRLARARCAARAEVAPLPAVPLKLLAHGMIDGPVMDHAIAAILA